jgi:hypothetical protein
MMMSTNYKMGSARSPCRAVGPVTFLMTLFRDGRVGVLFCCRCACVIGVSWVICYWRFLGDLRCVIAVRLHALLGLG